MNDPLAWIIEHAPLPDRLRHACFALTCLQAGIARLTARKREPLAAAGAPAGHPRHDGGAPVGPDIFQEPGLAATHPRAAAADGGVAGKVPARLVEALTAGLAREWRSELRRSEQRLSVASGCGACSDTSGGRRACYCVSVVAIVKVSQMGAVICSWQPSQSSL